MIMSETNLRYKKILLINLPGVEQSGYRPSPLGLLYLASYLKKHIPMISVNIIDGAIEGEKAVIKKIKTLKPDLVGVSVLTPSRHQSIKIAKIAKKYCPNSKIVLGGIHPTLMWQQMIEHYSVIDFIIKGEGEITLYELVSGNNLQKIKGLVWRKDKIIINNPDRPLIENLDTIPFPAWEMIDPLKYPSWGQGIINGINLETEPRVPIIFSRGCMGSCTFCSTWKIWRGYRFRNGKKVADEIEMLVNKYHARHFVFQDDTLTGSKKEITIFCREIIKRGIKIVIHGTTRVDFVDEELLKLMKRAGFYKLSYGVESGSPKILLGINKKTNLKEIIKAVTLTKKAGIQVCALMMFGLPGETMQDKLLTEKLIQKIKADEIGTIGEIWIFPGTTLFQQAKNAKLIDDSFWLSRQPYYIYRGGIGTDPIKRKLLIKDWYQFYLKNTFIGRMLSKIDNLLFNI